MGYAGLRMTASEYLALGETAERTELIDGVVCMSPRPTTRHQAALSLVQFQLELFVRSSPGFRYFPDVDLELGPSTVYAPDLVCYRPGRVTGFPGALTEAPDLIVEVLSPGTKAFDLTTKKDDYERFGVGEYWAVDPGDGRVRCYCRQETLLVEAPVSGDTLASTALPGFTLDIRPLRDLAGQG
jgi:Uma2 family endonuclease